MASPNEIGGAWSTGVAAVGVGASVGGLVVGASGTGVDVAEAPQAAETSSTSAAATVLKITNRFLSLISRNPRIANR